MLLVVVVSMVVVVLESSSWRAGRIANQDLKSSNAGGVAETQIEGKEIEIEVE